MRDNLIVDLQTQPQTQESHRYSFGRYTIILTRHVNHFLPEDWNAVYPHVLENYGFLKTLDESGLEQFQFRYLGVYDDQRLVGAAAFFIVEYSLDTSVGGPLRRFTNAIKKKFPKIFSIKALVCGIPTNQGHLGVQEEKKDVVECVLKGMEDLAAKEGASILAFKDFGGCYDTLLLPLKDLGFKRVHGLPDTELKIIFKEFDEYLKTLSGATRYDLRRKFKKAAGHVTWEVHDSLDEGMLNKAYALYRQVVDAHEMGFETLTIDFFRQAALNMPGGAKYFFWRVDGKPAAFLFCLVDENELIDYFLGLDYALAKEYHLYFIKFRDVMEWCLSNGIKKYTMGCSGYEPKRRLGFDFVPRSLYVKCRNRMWRPLFNVLVGLLRFENFDPELKRWLKRNGGVHQ